MHWFGTRGSEVQILSPRPSFKHLPGRRVGPNWRKSCDRGLDDREIVLDELRGEPRRSLLLFRSHVCHELSHAAIVHVCELHLSNFRVDVFEMRLPGLSRVELDRVPLLALHRLEPSLCLLLNTDGKVRGPCRPSLCLGVCSVLPAFCSGRMSAQGFRIAEC